MITGNELVELGFKPGKWFKEALEYINANDLTGDGSVDLNDIVLLIKYIFDPSIQIAQGASADIDGNNDVNLLDVIALIGIIFG